MKKLLGIILFLFIQNCFALSMQDAYVFSEADGSENNSCGISGSSSVAAVESALRQNRINIKGDTSNYSFYINNLAIDSSNRCAVHSSLLVSFYSYVDAPNLKNKKIFGQVVLCNNFYMLTGPAYNMQPRVNDVLKGLTEECISKIEKIQFVK